MKLPPAFLTKMEAQLGDAFPRFLASYDRPRAAGLRTNRLKIDPDALRALLPYLQEPVDWCADGFYYDDTAVRPAKHPYYYAGLYYLQEPSAMLPAGLLGVRPGQRVLDLCAAPGGKSIQLAGHLGRDGLLVVNEPNLPRARALLKNIERYGVVNVVVLNETPERIAAVFAGFFDKILVDAPCSGEGMFHKEPDMARDWSEAEVAKYVAWQAEILAAVPALLRPGGDVVYSTCTFSREEDEEQIAHFVAEHPGFTVRELRRLWPHEVWGEGHFAAAVSGPMSAAATQAAAVPAAGGLPPTAHLPPATAAALADFSAQVWGDPAAWQTWLPPGGSVIERAGHVLWEHHDLPPLRGLKVLRSGWLLGLLENGRFQPSPALALGLPPAAVGAAAQLCNLSAQDADERYLAIRYLRGETLQVDGREWPKGWHLVAVDGYALGWAKGAGARLKNEFPPGWRWED